ncbi:MAG: alpha/beta hydrolase [Thiothrix sp.]|nr:alpha/beta hydrolase [Thiothrix sp.]HPE62011.1 alpha/beta hydrolase [Thiolinea sp.]
MGSVYRLLQAGVLLSAVLGLAMPLPAEEVTIEQDGLQLRADWNLAGGKGPQDGVVLMLHGTLAHNRMEIVKTVSGLLNEAGYNTLAVNLGYGIDKRAEGMLDCTVDHRHRHADAVTELNAWMDWLKAQGVTKVAVWGHSRGGNQVAWFAGEHADDPVLDKVILVAPATWNAEQEAQAYAGRYGVSLDAVLGQAQALVDAGEGDTLMELPGFVYCERAKATAAAVLGYYQPDERRDTPTLLSKITRPVLLIMGSADEVVPDLPARLEGVSQDGLRLETIDGADHFFMDLYADEMTELITDFLGRE